MKRKLLISGMLLTLIIVVSVAFIITKNNSSNELVLNEDKKLINNSLLTLMLEQEDGTYKESTSNTWPSGNYAFNSEMSRCENGGELSWDREQGIVKLLSNKSDGCYVYFDLYNVVQITNVQTTKTTNSITLTVTVEAGENPVATYYFSIDGGRSYQESNTNTYTFSNLDYGTTYTIQVYAVDTEGYESNEEVIEVTTDNYVNPVVNSVTTTNIENDSITVSVSATGGTNNIQTYYYSINNGVYTGSSSNTYTFSGLSQGTTYNIRVYVTDTNGVESNVYPISIETERVVYLADICNNGNNLASCITSFYNSYGSDATKLYYHNSSLANGARDNSYRYAGASEEVNNYVCFGSTASTCPSDNLYRVIGVFYGEVKLIKGTNYGSYQWDIGGSNAWNASIKPDIRNTLNSAFLNTLSSTWQNQIADHGYKVGGMTSSYGYSTPITAYNYEAGSSSSSTTDIMKIGLMYVNDYGFAASPNYWTTNLEYYNGVANSNWMYLGSTEWTISRLLDNSLNVFLVNSSGSIRGSSPVSYSHSVRPVFYLNSNVQYSDGDGTQENPIRIEI